MSSTTTGVATADPATERSGTEAAMAGDEVDGPPSTGTDAPADGTTSIAEMRVEIDAIDAELVRLIQRRTELSRAIGAVRASEGGPRIVYSREMKVLDRFSALGSAGTDLGMLLLSMGRGKLGRR